MFMINAINGSNGINVYFSIIQILDSRSKNCGNDDYFITLSMYDMHSLYCLTL